MPPASFDVRCPYCQAPAELAKGEELAVWRKDKWFYRCQPCRAWVGCHEHTTRPLGTLANFELRKARRTAHDAFDTLWRTRAAHGVQKARAKGYKWLASALGIEGDECHISMFDVQTCQRVVKLCDPEAPEWP